MERPVAVRIRVLVDYRARDPRLRTRYRDSDHPGHVGLSLLLELRYSDHCEYLLLDTGRDWRNLTHNAGILREDLTQVSTIVITHWHIDHYGALPKLLTHLCPQARVYAPLLTPRAGQVLRRQGISSHDFVTRVRDTVELYPGLYLLRPLPTPEEGLLELPVLLQLQDHTTILFTGCFHYSVEDLRNLVEQITGTSRVQYLVGGLHLVYDTPEVGREKVRRLRDFTEKVIPLHCSGDVGRELCREVIGPERTLEVLCGDEVVVGESP